MTQSLDNLVTNIKALREKKGWTQTELAQHATLNVNTVFRLEQKRGSPSWATVNAIAEALGTNALELSKPVKVN